MRAKTKGLLQAIYIASTDVTIPDDDFRETVGRMAKRELGGYDNPDKFKREIQAIRVARLRGK